jgi:outer membrane receptor for ferrienterochelin and colicins
VKNKVKLLWVLVWVLSGVGSLHAQVSSVTVLQDNKKPLPDAVIRLTSLTHTRSRDELGLSNSEGKYLFEKKEAVEVHISHLGYNTITDTIFPPADKQYTISRTSTALNDIVVTGQYTAGSVANSVYEIKVINNETLRNKGATNLKEALANELNIDQSQDPVYGGGIGINGISGEGVKIMVDGVPIVGRLEGKLDLTQINLNNIERVEIIEGPMSVLYGTDALGGVINIITKNYQKEKFNVRGKFYYESVGQYNAELSGGFNFGKNQVQYSVGRNFFDGFTQNKSLVRASDWRPKEQYTADLKYIYTANKFKISLAGSFFREMMISRSEPKYFADRVTGRDEHFLTYRPRVTAAFLYRFKDNSQLDVTASYSGFYRFWNTVKKDLTNGQESIIPSETQDTSTFHHFMLRAIQSLYTKNNKVGFQFGIDVNHETTFQERILGHTQQITDAAAFASVKWTPVKGLDIQPAMRITYNTRYKAPPIPSLNIKYSVRDYLTFRASYGRGFRAPSLKELFLSFKDSNHDINGNKNLKAEDGHSINLSVNYRWKKGKHAINMEPGGFYNLIYNKIDLKIIPPNPETPPNISAFAYDNFKKVQTYGAELNLTYEFDRLVIKAGAMATRFETYDESIKETYIKIWSPDANAQVRYTIPKAEIGINVFYKYTGQKALFSLSSSVSTGIRSPFHNLDVSATKNFWKNRIQLTVGGKNLLGVTNIVSNGAGGVGHNFAQNTSLVGWGRTAYTTLVFQFSK